MKSLINYIYEDFETFRITDLEVPYNVTYNENNKITFKVPSTYSEDDFQLYIQDKYFNELPASDKLSEKFFGKNRNNIYDVLFEYEKYEKADNNSDDVIDWDDNNKNTVENYSYITVINLKYIIKFEEFDLKDGNDYNINKTLEKIFKNTDSSEINNYPLNIKLDDKNIKYSE